MSSLWRDIHYGARMLVRKPASTVVAVITLALGIALATATFTVVDAVLLRKLPVNDPNRVVVIHNQLPKINLPRTQVSALQYLDYSRHTDVLINCRIRHAKFQSHRRQSTGTFAGRQSHGELLRNARCQCRSGPVLHDGRRQGR